MAKHNWDTVEFTNPSGEFVSGEKCARAFVPNPLPIKWEPRGALLDMYVRAEKAISALNAVIGTTGTPDFVTVLYTRHEAVQSSRIEGTLASLDDLLQHEAGIGMDTEESARLSIAEVANCAKAIEESIRKVESDGEIDVELMTTAHRILWHKVNEKEKDPGMVRTAQNAIATRDKKIVFVPPPPDMVSRLLDELVKFIAVQNPQIPALVQCAMAHYQFEAIHPFGDGNGRIGRILISLMLAKNGVLSRPLLQLGGYLWDNRMEYYRCLSRVSQKSEWSNWHMLFMRAFAEQAEATTQTILELAEVHRKYVKMIPEVDDSMTVRILEMLFGNPYVTTSYIEKILKVSHTEASNGIAQLEKAGILRRISADHETCFWVAPEIIRVIDSSIK